MTDISKKLKVLFYLYEATGEDWMCDINYIVTEPVCPTVQLYAEPEDGQSPDPDKHIRVDMDTVEEGVDAVVKWALQKYPKVVK